MERLPTEDDMQAAREKLRAKFGEGARIAGKGGTRLKKRAVVHKSSTGDDKKLQTAIRRMGLSTIPGVDEVAMLRDGGKALVFHHPKVQAALGANTFIITGTSEEKSIDQLSPASIPELDPELVKKFAAQWKKMNAEKSSPAAHAGVSGTEDEDEDDDIPDLIPDFEAAAADGAS